MSRRDQLELGIEPEAASLAPADDVEPALDLSPEQRSVVAFDDDLVVTAGAGSGKTRTLVELYARILDDPADGDENAEPAGPDRILCLTFTERAARETKERIRDRTVSAEHRRRLEVAPIATFHAFCATLLRHYPFEAGIDPAFTVLTEEAAQDLLFRAATDTLREGARTGDQAARQAIETVGFGRSAERLAMIVQALRTAGWAPRDPIRAFERRLAEVHSALDGSLRRDVTAAGLTLLQAAVDADLKKPKARAYLHDVETALRDWVDDATPARSEALRQACTAPSRMWRFPDATPLRHAVTDAVERFEQARTEIENAASLGCWPALAVTVRGRYRRLRKARRALDFDDLLLRTRDLLREHPSIVRALSERYHTVLVDEHQDTDPVQNEILETLLAVEPASAAGSTPRWCVVGDAQQAIYGFRGARVEAYQKLAEDAEARGARRVLRSNYRSRPELIEFFNAFFPTVLDPSRHPGQTPYEPQVAHRPPAQRAVVETLLPMPDGGGKGARTTSDERRLAEARALAMRLREACNPESMHVVPIADPTDGAERAARAGDIAILMRRMTDVEPYRQALQAVGFEAIVVGTGGFYGRQETYDVLNAIESVFVPDDPVPLIGFLRSPMIGVPDDVLLRRVQNWDRRSGVPLRAHLFEQVTVASTAEEREIMATARDILDALEARADREALGATVSWLIDRTAYAATIAALPDRAQRVANLERLIAHADNAPRNGVSLLAEWAGHLRRRIEKPPRERDAPISDPGNRVVIMSIHQAKGLEFPIVAVADIGTAPWGSIAEFAFDDQYGVVAKLWDVDAGAWKPTLTHTLAGERLRERDEREEARLLYVAATRARDHLIFSAAATQKQWYKDLVTFSSTPHAGLSTLSIDTWASRYAEAVASQPELPDPGRPYERVLASPRETTTAREAAERLAGPRITAGPGPRSAMRAAKRRGVLGHAALERLPLPFDPAFDLDTWLQAVIGVPTEDVRTLARFVRDRVGPRLLAAREVHRERPFRLHLPNDAGVVSGTIDCLVRDDADTWSVWDYKFGAPAVEPSAFHRAQLEIYGLAAASALGVDHVTGVLWHVVDDTNECFDWDPDALADLERRLSDALRATPVGSPREHLRREDRPAASHPVR